MRLAVVRLDLFHVDLDEDLLPLGHDGKGEDAVEAGRVLDVTRADVEARAVPGLPGSKWSAVLCVICTYASDAVVSRVEYALRQRGTLRAVSSLPHQRFSLADVMSALGRRGVILALDAAEEDLQEVRRASMTGEVVMTHILVLLARLDRLHLAIPAEW
jgi:hypothetical protein